MFPYLLRTLGEWLYASSDSQFVSGLLTPIGIVLTLIEVIALSLAYRELTATGASWDESS